MFDDQQFRIRLTRLGLRPHQWQEGFGNNDVGFDAAFFEFDTVMETPRRARPSIRQSEYRPFVFSGDLLDQFRRCGLRRAVLEQVINIVGRAERAHLVAHALKQFTRVRFRVRDNGDRVAAPIGGTGNYRLAAVVGRFRQAERWIDDTHSGLLLRRPTA